MIRVAIIGAGNIARQVHLPAYKQNKIVQVVAISDVNQKTLTETSELFDIEQVFDDYKKMIDQVKPDVVSVCTPNLFHAEQTMYALKSGAHVFCEKPPAMNYQEVKDMVELATTQQKVLGFNFHHRFRDDVHVIKSLLKTHNEPTYLCEISALRRRGIPGWGVFTNRRLQGGGALMDFGVHMLDLALYMLDFPKPLFATATISDIIGKQGGSGDFGDWKGGEHFTVEDSLFGSVTFENGLMMQIKTAFTYHMTQKNEMNITLHNPLYALNLKPLQIMTYDKYEDLTFADKQTNLEGVNEFIHHIIDRNKPLRVHGRSVLMTQLILDMLYKSARELRPVLAESIL